MSKSWPLQVLTESERDRIVSVAQRLLPDADVTALPQDLQGCCSYTFIAIQSRGEQQQLAQILQFRPRHFEFDMRRIDGLTTVYGRYAPEIAHLRTIPVTGIGNLQASLSSIIPGTPYNLVQVRRTGLSHPEISRQKRILSSFADFLSQGWMRSARFPQKEACDGRVGCTISSRLEMLSQRLPSESSRCIARDVAKRLHLLDRLPNVLTHGDILPANIMMNTSTNSIQGLIDWAEAEYLPFGICLYGLEHFLGFDAPNGSQFVYYHSAEELRRHFWAELSKRVPELRNGHTQAQVRLARDAGVLLWFGFAWDDGAINRVINARDDVAELIHLHTFLGTGRSSYRSTANDARSARL